MAKNIAIKVAGTEREPIDIAIEPGTKAAEICSQLNLGGYKLAKGPDHAPFDDGVNVYQHVEDGAKLYAITNAELG